MAAAAKRTDGGERPSRPGTSDRPDLISNQPDAVLGTIVSLLPIKDGCRTQALSRRWRPIWRSAPLYLDVDRGSSGVSRLPDKTISDILSGHLGPVPRFSITGITPLPYRYDRHTGRKIIDKDGDTRFESWLGSRNVLASVQVLDLGYRYAYDGYSYGGYDCYNVLPPSVFRLAPALRVATFASCSLPANLAVDFPSLEELSMHNVTMTEEALSAVLVGCPGALRSLVLEKMVGCHRLRISSPSLRSMGFSVPWNKLEGGSSIIVDVQEMVIEDAPCLERLLPLNPHDGPAIIRVVHAPKLEILGSVGKGISQLHLGTTVFKEMIAASLTTTMPTVKVLALNHVGPDLDAVLDFLKCFPSLERLYIILDPISENGLYPQKNTKTMRKYALPNDPIECLKFHLKKVALKFYCGKGLEVDFARFFVLNARVLERMEFGIINDRQQEWRDNHNMELQLEDRASRDARFEFKKFTWTTFNYINKRTHDLLMDDPFNASFLDGYVTLWEV